MSQNRGREAVHTVLLCGLPQVCARSQHVLADVGALVRDGACWIAPVAGRHPLVGAPVVVGRQRGGRRGGGGAQFAGTIAVGAAEERGPQFPALCRVCARPGPIRLSW